MSLPTSANMEPRSDRLAAIDIGSNSCRLVVAELLPGGDYRILDEERESTRLAASLSSTGLLDEESMNASLAALRRFRKIASGFQVSQLRTIATCAVREAENGEEFCRRVAEESGLNIEVISSETEGQLAFASVAKAFDISDKNVVIADIGGGSTELVFASANHVEEIFPTKLGALRLTEQFGTSRRLFGEDYDRMVEEIDRQLKRVVRKLPFAPQMLIGSGGTFTTLASILLAMRGQMGQPQWGYRASRADVRHLLDRLQKMSLKQRRNMPGLSADRADIIVAGLAIIDRLMKRFKVNLLQVHTRGVRDGLLLSMFEAAAPPPVESIEERDDAVLKFAASCGVDLPHAQQVSRLAGEIFAQVAEPFGMNPGDRSLLETAAILQDVGYLISYQRHHKHSYQLIVNSQLPGYQRHELELLANVARYHRGSRPKQKHANYRRLSEEDQLRVTRLVAVLRLAGGLDRSHSQHVEDVSVKIHSRPTGPRVVLHVTCRDDPEVDLWAARTRSKMFEKIFGAQVVVLASSKLSSEG